MAYKFVSHIDWGLAIKAEEEEEKEKEDGKGKINIKNWPFTQPE